MVSKLIKKGFKTITSQQYTIMSAAAVIGVVYTLSALLGFVRNRLLSGYFGDSPELGVYFAADNIPNLLFSLIVSGALSAAFIPVFTNRYKKSKEEAWMMTSSILNLSLLMFLVFALVIFFKADFVARQTLARDSSLSNSELFLLAELMRIMMLAQILFIGSSFLTSILQSFNHFILPSLAPFFYNLGVILFIVLFANRYGVYAPAYGMIFGAFLHFGVQFPLVKRLGFRYKGVLDVKDKGVREIYRLMIPRTIGQAVQKLMVPFYTNLALYISAPSNVILTFAESIQDLPVRIFGVSIGQAALPILAKSFDDEGNLQKFKKLLIRTIHQVIFFVAPVSIIMFVLRVPLVRLAVGAKKYSWEATVMTSYTLGFFSISLVAQSMTLIFSRAFYALRDTRTPAFVAMGSFAINAMVAYFFVKVLGLGVWSLALAYSVGSLFNSVTLFVFMVRRIGGMDIVDFLSPINKIGFATLAMGFSLYVPMKALDQLVFDTTRTIWLIALTAIVSFLGVSTYLSLSWVFGIKELEIAVSALKRVKGALISQPV